MTCRTYSISVSPVVRFASTSQVLTTVGPREDIDEPSKVVVIVGLYDTWLALLSSLIVSAGMDLENPRPLHVFVGVLTSVTTGFFNIALVANSFFCS